MGAIFEHIRSEWHVLKCAPWSFGLLFVAGLSFGFYTGTAWSDREIANLKSLIEIKDAQRQLSEQQLSILKSQLGNVPPSSVSISGDDQVANQLKSIFAESGWQVSSGKTMANGIALQALDANAANSIQKALQSAGVQYKALSSHSHDNSTTDIFLGKQSNR